MSRVLTGNKLVESVRNRAMIPNDTSVYTDANILEVANEEIDVQLLDKLLTLHEEHLTVHIDIPREESGVYDIPYRAVGNKIRDIVLISGQTYYETTQISIGELSDYTIDNSAFNDGLDKFYVESNQIKFVNNNRSYDTVRIYFYIRPNVLTKTSEAAVISQINSPDLVNDTIRFQFSSMPAKFSSTEFFDIVGVRTPNKIKIWDISPSLLRDNEGNVTGFDINTAELYIVFKYSDVKDVITDIKVGDYVCKAEESPVPNLPTEMHPLLAQLTAVHILEAMGDTEGLANAQRRLDSMVKSVMELVDDRVELAPKKIKPRNSVLNEARLGSVTRTRRR